MFGWLAEMLNTNMLREILYPAKIGRRGSGRWIGIDSLNQV